jgi:hypothetical protein
MVASNGNGNGNGKPLLTVGNLISILVAGGMVGSAYAAVSRETADNKRAIDDLYRIVYEFKRDTQEWEKNEITYDAEIRGELRRWEDRMSDLAMRVGQPPKPNGPP